MPAMFLMTERQQVVMPAMLDMSHRADRACVIKTLDRRVVSTKIIRAPVPKLSFPYWRKAHLGVVALPAIASSPLLARKADSCGCALDGHETSAMAIFLAVGMSLCSSLSVVLIAFRKRWSMSYSVTTFASIMQQGCRAVVLTLKLG